jgi:hypothetical protein
MNDVDMLCLRCSKFPLKALRERDSIHTTLLTTGWNADLIKEHLDEAIQFAEDARRAYLAARRARRAAEREADKAWRAQIAKVA